MAESLVFKVENREGRGTSKARHLRKKGLIPAVVYGHGEETTSITMPAGEMAKAIRHGVRVVDLDTKGDLQKVLIREVQWDHLGMELLHVDFARVAADERVVVSVPLEIRGIAPGIAAGGVLDQPMHTLSVECPVIAVPESIRVNVGELQLDAFLHVRDLVLPVGVTAKADPDAVVVHIALKQAPVEEAAAPAAEGTEPEVIGRKAAEEEEAAE